MPEIPPWVKGVAAAAGVGAVVGGVYYYMKKKAAEEDGQDGRLYEAVFLCLDADRSGGLSRQELEKVLNSEEGKEQVTSMFNKMDTGGKQAAVPGGLNLGLEVGDGQVSRAEWCKYWEAKQQDEGNTAAMEELKEIMALLKVDAAAATAAAKSHAQQLLKINTAFTLLDTNGDQFLVLSELEAASDDKASIRKLFTQMDKRGAKAAGISLDMGDGKVSREEWVAFWEAEFARGEAGADLALQALVK